MLSYLFCLTFARRAYTHIHTDRVVPHLSRATFPLPRILPSRYLHGHFHTIVHRHRKLEEHSNPLLRGPWLKAVLGELTVDDFDAFFRDPSPHIPPSFHPTLKLAYESIFVSATQGIVDHGNLKKVLIINLGQRPMVVQTVDDVLNLAATTIFLDKFPTPVQCAQFLGAHAKVVGAIHRHIQPTSPRMIGFFKPTGYPFTENVSIIISSLRATHPGPTVRSLTQRYDELGRRLGDMVGRRAENHAFLSLGDAMRNMKPMESRVLNALKANSTADPNKTAVRTLLAGSRKQRFDILHRTSTRVDG